MTLLLLSALALAEPLPCTAEDVARCTRAAVELRVCLGELAQAEEAARLCLPALQERDQLRADLDRAILQRDRARARTRVAAGSAVALGAVLVVAVAL